MRMTSACARESTGTPRAATAEAPASSVRRRLSMDSIIGFPSFERWVGNDGLLANSSSRRESLRADIALLAMGGDRLYRAAKAARCPDGPSLHWTTTCRDADGSEVRMDLELRGLRVMVSAGAGGIGLAIARAFVREGARVSVCDVDAAALAQLAHSDSTLHAVSCDVSSRDEVARW